MNRYRQVCMAILCCLTADVVCAQYLRTTGIPQKESDVLLNTGFGLSPLPDSLATPLLERLGNCIVDSADAHHHFTNAHNVMGPVQCVVIVSNILAQVSATSVGLMGPNYIVCPKEQIAFSDPELYEAIATYYVTSGVAHVMWSIRTGASDAVDRVQTSIDLGWIDATTCPVGGDSEVMQWFLRTMASSRWNRLEYRYSPRTTESFGCSAAED